MTRIWPYARLAMAALIAVSIVAQLDVTLSGAIDGRRDVVTTAWNFFSFFTIQSNLIATVALTAAALGALRHPDRHRDTPVVAVLLAAASTYMIITGVVYNILLRDVTLPQGTTVAWSNEVLHLVGPLFFLLDLLLAVRRRPLPWGSLVLLIGYPILWITYTLIRGPITTNPTTREPWWYPYPFLNPHELGGWGPVAGYAVTIAIALALFATAAVWWGRFRAAPTGGADEAARADAR